MNITIFCLLFLEIATEDKPISKLFLAMELETRNTMSPLTINIK